MARICTVCVPSLKPVNVSGVVAVGKELPSTLAWKVLRVSLLVKGMVGLGGVVVASGAAVMVGLGAGVSIVTVKEAEAGL